MKATGVYQLFDPNTHKLFGCNVFKLGGVIEIIYLALVIVACFTSVYYYLYDFVLVVKYIVFTIAALFAFVKLYFIIRNADALWEFVSFTSIHFLSFGNRRESVLVRARSISITISNVYTISWIFVLAVYVFPPIIAVGDNRIRIKTNDVAHDEYRYNVLNLILFPVTVEFYNDNFTLFYLIETTALIFYCHSMLIYDCLIISMCITIKHQLKTIALSYSELGHNDVNTGDSTSNFFSACTNRIFFFKKKINVRKSQ